MKNQLPLSPESQVEILIEGLHSGSYEFTRFNSTRPSAAHALNAVVFADAAGRTNELIRAFNKGRLIGESLNSVKDLANLPGNEANPAFFVREIRRRARHLHLQCSVWGRKELLARKCRAILAVGQGSRQSPALITLRYPGRSSKLKPLVLVGKTITFDTGGISLKPSKSMEWMKFDKCGGMAVLAVMDIIARLKPSRPVIGVLAVAENMPGGNSIRPGDIIRAHSGKTIEILNTDAEGRLVLADALSVASRFKPEAMVDLATLTGAVIVALGHQLAAVMGNQDRLVRELCLAGDSCGERLHALPILPEFNDALRSTFADLKNIAADGFGAGTLIGGAFLDEFVPHNIPWAHLDIAGTAWEESTRPYGAPGATLFGARLLVNWILSKSP